MREILFRGWYQEFEKSGYWVQGSLNSNVLDPDNPIIMQKCKHSYSGYVNYPVVPESIGQYCGRNYASGEKAFEGDIFYCDKYPFVKDGNINYHGVIEYVEHPAFMGWYYGLIVVSDRVTGNVNGSGMPDLENIPLCYVGNKYQNPELLEPRE